MLKKRRFLAINSSISEELDQSCNQKPALSPLATSLVYKNGCSLRILQVTVSRSINLLLLQNCTEKFLTKADILVRLNVPKPLKNLCTQFDADTL